MTLGSHRKMTGLVSNQNDGDTQWTLANDECWVTVLAPGQLTENKYRTTHSQEKSGQMSSATPRSAPGRQGLDAALAQAFHVPVAPSTGGLRCVPVQSLS